jgi:hypothetical protein
LNLVVVVDAARSIAAIEATRRFAFSGRRFAWIG